MYTGLMKIDTFRRKSSKFMHVGGQYTGAKLLEASVASVVR